jgi:hypothetical protein
LLPLCGCADHPAPATVPAPQQAGAEFDPGAAGTIQGRVTWSGALPSIPPMRGWTDVACELTAPKSHSEPNPNAPCIDAATSGVGAAVIFLRGVDPRRGRQWDLPPVRVEQTDYHLLVCQGDAAGRDGFVRRGDRIEMVSSGPAFHALHATGAAYFGLTFPDAAQSRLRTLDQPGLVELTSAAGYFWVRGYLFVDDHPYYTRTNTEGRFTLPQVPPGRYEVVCWLPNWHEAGHDRDPETSQVVRVTFRPPVEHVKTVDVPPNGTQEVQFTWTLDDF